MLDYRSMSLPNERELVETVVLTPLGSRADQRQAMGKVPHHHDIGGVKDAVTWQLEQILIDYIIHKDIEK